LHLVDEVVPCFLALVRDTDIYGKLEIMDIKKRRNSEDTLHGQEG
jgi:hypothetical protein